MGNRPKACFWLKDKDSLIRQKERERGNVGEEEEQEKEKRHSTQR
jgi:hypothetical protein